MQRHELIAQLGQLKLHGMASAFDEAVIQGVRRQLTVQEILARLCQAEVAERTARSIRYQMGIARFPVVKDLDSFRFAGSPVNEMLLRALYDGDFLRQTRNLIFIGGTGTGQQCNRLGSVVSRVHGRSPAGHRHCASNPAPGTACRDSAARRSRMRAGDACRHCAR